MPQCLMAEQVDREHRRRRRACLPPHKSVSCTAALCESSNALTAESSASSNSSLSSHTVATRASRSSCSSSSRLSSSLPLSSSVPLSSSRLSRWSLGEEDRQEPEEQQEEQLQGDDDAEEYATRWSLELDRSAQRSPQPRPRQAKAPTSWPSKYSSTLSCLSLGCCMSPSDSTPNCSPFRRDKDTVIKPISSSSSLDTMPSPATPGVKPYSAATSSSTSHHNRVNSDEMVVMQSRALCHLQHLRIYEHAHLERERPARWSYVDEPEEEQQDDLDSLEGTDSSSSLPAPPPLCTVHQPNNKTKWTRGRQAIIKWQPLDEDVEFVRIELIEKGMNATTIIAKQAPNNGTFKYHKVPWGMACGAKYFVRISNASNSRQVAYSSFFEIVAP